MTQTANNYAKALFELRISAGDLSEVRDIFESCPELGEALRDPSVAAAAKHNIIDRVFLESTVNFLKLLTDNGSTELIGEIFEAYDKLVSDFQRMCCKAELIYCTPPTEERIEGIKRKISKLWGVTKTDLKLTRDTDIIGGFIIRSRR